MTDNYDGPQMAAKILRQQREIERLQSRVTEEERELDITHNIVRNHKEEAESLRARVAEAARLLSWCQLHWSTYNYEGAPSAYFLSKIDAWLEPIISRGDNRS